MINSRNLKKIEEQDYDLYYPIRAEKKNLWWTGYDNAPDYDAFFNWFKSRANDPNRHIYLLLDNDVCIGALHLDFYSDHSFIGYNIKEQHEGKGYATYMVQKAIEIAFKRPNIKSMKAWINYQNEGSMRVSEKNGFVKSGITETRKRFGVDELYNLYQFVPQ